MPSKDEVDSQEPIAVEQFCELKGNNSVDLANENSEVVEEIFVQEEAYTVTDNNRFKELCGVNTVDIEKIDAKTCYKVGDNDSDSICPEVKESPMLDIKDTSFGKNDPKCVDEIYIENIHLTSNKHSVSLQLQEENVENSKLIEMEKPSAVSCAEILAEQAQNKVKISGQEI